MFTNLYVNYNPCDHIFDIGSADMMPTHIVNCRVSGKKNHFTSFKENIIKS